MATKQNNAPHLTKMTVGELLDELLLVCSLALVITGHLVEAAAGRRKPRGEREGTKRAEILAMLRKGTTTADICKATGWKQHSVHGFLTALRKQGELTAERIEGGTCVYHFA
jgi:hypothetical protein